MSRVRLIVVALTLVVLAALIGWQLQRQRLVQDCVEAGGAWHGPRSACLSPLRPILRREYQRS